MVRLRIGLLLFGCAFLALPQADENHATRTNAGSLSRLLNAKIFAFGGIGFASHITDGETAYHSLEATPDAESQFELVLKNGSPAGKAYALVGLYHLAPERFASFAPTINRKSKVMTGHGCLLGQETLGTIFDDVQAGRYTANASAGEGAKPHPSTPSR